MLIEANVPETQIHVEVRIGGEGEPYAVRTLLRWAIMGPLNDNIRSQSDKANVNFLTYASEVVGLENFDSISSNRKEMSVQDKEALGKLNSSVRVVDDYYEMGML